MSNRPVGPYFLTVTTSPDPLRVGFGDISVLVQTDKALELGATVTVTAYGPKGHGLSRAFPATHATATDPSFYSANVRLDAPGPWRFTVRVQGPLGEVQTGFAVVSPALLGWTPFQIVAEALPAAGLAAFVVWRFWERRRQEG